MKSAFRPVIIACLAASASVLAFLPAGADPEDKAPEQKPVPRYVVIEYSDGWAGGIVGQTDDGVSMSLCNTTKTGYGVGLKRTVTDAEGTWEEYLVGPVSREETFALLDAIEGLWKLPVENPKYGEDIYKMAASLSVRVQQDGKWREWHNGFPTSCTSGGGTSIVRPTEVQKQAFKEIVAKVKDVVTQHATKVDSRRKRV